MKEELAKPEDLAGRIKALQKQHLSDLERLYDFHTQDYLDEALDRRRARDETQFLDKEELDLAIIAGYKRLEVSHSVFGSYICIDTGMHRACTVVLVNRMPQRSTGITTSTDCDTTTLHSLTHYSNGSEMNNAFGMLDSHSRYMNSEPFQTRMYNCGSLGF